MKNGQGFVGLLVLTALTGLLVSGAAASDVQALSLSADDRACPALCSGGEVGPPAAGLF